MVSNISSCTKALVLLISLLGVSSFSLRAQEKDFATWANVGFEYKLKPAFTVSGGLEWRTKDDLGKTDRWGLKIYYLPYAYSVKVSKVSNISSCTKDRKNTRLNYSHVLVSSIPSSA